MKYLLFLSILLTGAVGALCQENYPTVRTAEEAYARHEYQRAAHLYEKIVTFHHVPANAQDRLAECYREQNDFGKAAKIYDQITTQHPQNAQAWIYYGDILKSMGRYPEAKAAYRQVPDSLRVVRFDGTGWTAVSDVPQVFVSAKSPEAEIAAIANAA